MTSVKGCWVCRLRCYCEPFGHCGIRWHREQRREHTVEAHSNLSWDSSRFNPIHNIQSIPIQSWDSSHPIHKSFCSKQVLPNGCWLFFCPLINYDPLGWSQNNRNITRFSQNPLVGLRNCFLSFSFQNVFTATWAQIFLADFLLLIPWLGGGHLRLQLPP